jgi:hypothetical protein
MTLYAGRMTSPEQAARELAAAIGAIMVASDHMDTVCVIGNHIEVRLYPAEAVELASWIRSNTEPSRDNPWQQQFDFKTE